MGFGISERSEIRFDNGIHMLEGIAMLLEPEAQEGRWLSCDEHGNSRLRRLMLYMPEQAIGKTDWANVARAVCPTEELFEAVVEVQTQGSRRVGTQCSRPVHVGQWDDAAQDLIYDAS